MYTTYTASQHLTGIGLYTSRRNFNLKLYWILFVVITTQNLFKSSLVIWGNLIIIFFLSLFTVNHPLEKSFSHSYYNLKLLFSHSLLNTIKRKTKKKEGKFIATDYEKKFNYDLWLMLRMPLNRNIKIKLLFNYIL